MLHKICSSPVCAVQIWIKLTPSKNMDTGMCLSISLVLSFRMKPQYVFYIYVFLLLGGEISGTSGYTEDILKYRTIPKATPTFKMCTDGTLTIP